MVAVGAGALREQGVRCDVGLGVTAFSGDGHFRRVCGKTVGVVLLRVL